MKQFNIHELFFTAPTFVTREVGNISHWQPHSMHDEYWHPHVDKNNTAHYDYSGLLYLNDHGVDYDGGMFSFLDGLWPPQAMPCYDEDLLAMGAPKSCHTFSEEGMCTGDVGGGSTIADYCPEACGVCERIYQPPRSNSKQQNKQDTDGREEGDSNTDLVIDGSLDFEFGENGQTILKNQTAHLVEPAAGRLVIFSSGQENLHQVRQVHRGTRYVMSMWFTCNPDRYFPDFLDGNMHTHFVNHDDEGDAILATEQKGEKQKKKKKRKRKRTSVAKENQIDSTKKHNEL
jgi:hypothetical protein